MTNGYKRFSKTNSTDPRQRVPLMQRCNTFWKFPRCPGETFRVMIWRQEGNLQTTLTGGLYGIKLNEDEVE